PDQALYDHGTVVSLTALPDSGYHFTDWGGDLSGSTNPENLTMDSDKSVTANFSIDTYTITATAGVGGTITPSGAVSVDSGADQAFTIAADSGYHILAVLVDGVSQGTIGSYTFTNVVANHTIEASFEEDLAAVIASVADASGFPGQTAIPVTISVSDIGTREIYGIDLTLTYDDSLIQATGVNLGSLTSGWGLFSNTATSGQVTIALYGTTALPAGGGNLAEVSFDVLATAGAGSVGALVLTQADFEEVPADGVSNGSFTISSAPTYTITATAGVGGTITPSGAVTVLETADQAFTIAADT
ncbi:unnamed protein product, partial [marine sediment metagenome]